MLEAAADKKAEDPVALNLKGIASFTDAFVILGGNQRRQTQAISRDFYKLEMLWGDAPRMAAGAPGSRGNKGTSVVRKG